MKHKKFGFTLIEVALFLAVTGALFVAILVGTQNSIWQQRYNDATQSFVNFLRNVYAEVSNPQSLGDGRSDLAIYGRLITFGESVGLDGQSIPENEQKFFVYDVIGKTGEPSEENPEGVMMSGPVADVLVALDANVVVRDDSEEGTFVPAGIAVSYSPIWGALIEKGDSSDLNDLYRGSVLIIRHPASGTIMTLTSDKVIEVNKAIKEANSGLVSSRNNIEKLLTLELGGDDSGVMRASFEIAETDFCVNPYGLGETGSSRRNVRILKNAHNASGVELIDLDSESNVCTN